MQQVRQIFGCQLLHEEADKAEAGEVRQDICHLIRG